MPTPSAKTVSRRKVAAGMAWAVPTAVLSTTAPALALSSADNSYRFRGSVNGDIFYKGARCYNSYFDSYGNQITGLEIDNQTDLDTAPLGFTIVEENQQGTSTPSERTEATIARPMQLVVAYPQGMVDLNSPFIFSSGTEANWSYPTHTVTTMTNPDGYTWDYDVFTFTWRGDATQSTVPDVDDPQSWDGTALVGQFGANTGGYCVVPGGNNTWYFSNYYAGGTASDLGWYDGQLGTYTTANGFTGNVRANSSDGWIAYQW